MYMYIYMYCSLTPACSRVFGIHVVITDFTDSITTMYSHVHVQAYMQVTVVTAGAYECCEGASNSNMFCKPAVVESHLCKLPYMENLCKLRK